MVAWFVSASTFSFSRLLRSVSGGWIPCLGRFYGTTLVNKNKMLVTWLTYTKITVEKLTFFTRNRKTIVNTLKRCLWLKAMYTTVSDIHVRQLPTSVAESIVWLHFDADSCTVIRFVLIDPKKTKYFFTKWPNINFKEDQNYNFVLLDMPHLEGLMDKQQSHFYVCRLRCAQVQFTGVGRGQLPLINF